MIRLGNVTINSVSLGGVSVGKQYLGDVVIYGGDGPAAPPVAAPTYVSGLDYDTEWNQNTAVSINLDTCFTDATSYSVIGGALPAGVSISGSSLSGTPTTFTGREWVIIRAMNATGHVDRTFMVSVRPDTSAGAFGTGYTTVYENATFGKNTLENVNNLLLRNLTLTGEIQLRGCTNVLIIDCVVDHTAQDDGFRFSQTGNGCDNVVIYGNTIRNVNKDGINLSGDWPHNGPDIHILNNLLENCGDNANPKEHGMYLHSMCTVQGNVVKNSNFGNAISTRSSATIKNNFIDGAEFAGISYFCDHPESGANPWICSGNVIVDASNGSGVNDGDIILRDVPTLANRVDTFTITDNIVTTTTQAQVETGTGYSGATITETGTQLMTATQARALFP